MQVAKSAGSKHRPVIWVISQTPSPSVSCEAEYQLEQHVSDRTSHGIALLCRPADLSNACKSRIQSALSVLADKTQKSHM